MPYIVGASFANVQHSFDSPMILEAFAVSSDQKSNLDIIKTKEEINTPEFQTNLFDLSAVEQEINRFKKFTLRSKVISIPRKDRKRFENSLSFMYDSYLRVLESLKLANPLLTSEGLETCFLHVPLDEEANELSIDLSYFNHPIYKYNIKFQKHSECEPILELARLGVWFENLDLLRRRTPFINKQIVENRNLRFLQFHKIVWNSPPLELYSNSFVGYPRLIFKSQTETEDIIIQTGQEVNILPIVRACSGVEDGYLVPRCSCSSRKQPFGRLLEKRKSEKCSACSDRSKGPNCLFQRAKCNGKQVKCEDRKFANDVCHGDFCIYLTLYDNKLKVGRSMESRIVGRLIEQGAFDAVVFYPVPELPLADYLEVQLTKMLRHHLPSLAISKIQKVGEKVTSKERLAHISSVYTKPPSSDERTKIYDKIIELMVSLRARESTYLLSLERKKIGFDKNWILPNDSTFYKYPVSNLRFHHLKGKISGVAGPFVIINEKAYDFSKMEGYVIVIPNQ